MDESSRRTKKLNKIPQGCSSKMEEYLNKKCCCFLFDWQIAKEAEFFSFGTNDLTQMTFGYSRDDVGKFLPIYISKGILQNDPFEVSAIFQKSLKRS